MKIIIATDGSEYSRAAIEKSCELVCDAAHLEIKVVAVYQMFIPLDSFPQSVQYTESFEEAMREQAKKHSDDAVETIKKLLPAADLTTLVKTGAFDRVIVETAEEWNADLIVVGSHGRGFWGRALIGSTSDAVIHHAPCSVLVVKKNSVGDSDEN